MRTSLLVTAAGAALIASPALAQNAPASPAAPRVDSRATWFEVADRDDDERLSRAEYTELRLATVDARWVRNYRGDARARRTAAIERSFAAVDLNGDGALSLTEFANAGSVTASAANEYWDWDPEYVTAGFYLSVTPVRTAVLHGRKVYDIAGAQVGTIERVVQSQDSYFAVLALPRVSGGQAQQSRVSAMVPLEDLLLHRANSAFLLSQRGAEYLRSPAGRTVAGAQPVDTLYAS